MLPPLLGRLPEFGGAEGLRKIASISELSNVVYGMMQSEEFKTKWSSGGFSLPEVPVMCERDGVRLWFFLSDRMVGWRAAQGKYEELLAESLRRFIKPGMLCCDLGANIGYFSLLMAQSGARVYSFEPFQKNYHLLLRNIEANGFESLVRPAMRAVMDVEGDVSLWVDANESDYVSMYVTSGGGGLGGREVFIKGVNLDSAVDEHERVDCIKMDIEGAEVLAVKGMERILGRDKPRVYFEFNPVCIRDHSRMDPKALLDQFGEYGYELFDLHGKPWRYNGSDEVENLVAIHPGQQA